MASDAVTAQEEAGLLDEIVVTATARPEERRRITGTTQIIDRATIERSTARSVTDLLAENAVGFFSEWTAAQTSINLRGAATDGQGRDFRSQVLVLINGRRAGTANLSKLSTADVERIEIVRGPSSVIYGSQNMGGVINLIMKSGYNAPPIRLDVQAGSWGLWQSHAQASGGNERVEWYLGVGGGARGDHTSGRGGTRMENTAWERRGISGALGFYVDERHRIDLKLRTDGIYDAGFRGSGANLISRDDRYNRSLDVTYEGVATNGRASWLAHFYSLTDVDKFKWASPIMRVGINAAPGTSSDYNRRDLEITGLRLQPRLKLGRTNDLLLAYDLERSRLRSRRFRVALPGGPAGQVPPYDNNQTERVQALYFEDAQTLFDDRLTLRGGWRKTWGRTRFDETPNLPLQRSAQRTYNTQTWSAGATWKAMDGFNLRLAASTGFRAPTATELAADFTAVGGGRIFGNPKLKPETSRQVELGASLQRPSWSLDFALFQNLIADRIITVSRGANTNTSDYANNGADVVARGLELNAQVDLNKALNLGSNAYRLSAWSQAYYHFQMRDKGAPATARTDRVQRMYRYEGSAGLRCERGTSRLAGDWSLQLTALRRGPMWYDTEENLLIPAGEPNASYIHRKNAFTIWNLRGDYRIDKNFKLYAALNNFFNENQHPIFIAIDQRPCLANPAFQNGGCGTSMPGREFLVGLQASF